MYTPVLQPEMEEEIESTFLLRKCAQGNNGEKSRASALGLSLTYRSGPDQHMSEMQLGRVAHSGAAKSRGLGVTPRMVAIFWMGRVFVG